MIIKAIRTTGLSIALAATFLVAAGSSSAFAQDWRGRDHGRAGRQEDHRERRDFRGDRRDRGNGDHNEGFRRDGDHRDRR